MPEISRFLGIIIFMYFNDHEPPHFHARYNEFRGKLTINELQLIEGRLPKRILALVLEWANNHRAELLENWETLKKEGKYKRIKPLV
ncbi:MAG: DUF4160 domain-containing protein [Candidatus Aminicenantes bacterium]|nr:DUF4160 domain-containing protein [Candidatus Aminicenantes bacterium]